MIHEIRDKIVELSYNYEFQKEIRGNKGFEDDVFEQKMEAVGWKFGQAWCSYFAELVWKEAYGHFDSSIITKLNKLFSANAVQTWSNFYKSKSFKTGNSAEPGDLAVWANYKLGEAMKSGVWTLGHIGIVTKTAQLFFLSMEGNTNKHGGREGWLVAEKKREYSFYEDNGLKLLGFVKPKSV